MFDALSGAAERFRSGLDFIWGHEDTKLITGILQDGVANTAEGVAFLHQMYQTPHKGDKSGIQVEVLDHPNSPLKGLDPNKIKERIDLPHVKPGQIERQIEIFGSNAGSMAAMKLVDFIGGEECPEAVYLNIISRSRNGGELRANFFEHLDNSNMFFLTRWFAKLVFMIIGPSMNGALTSGMLGMYGDLEAHLQQLRERRDIDVVIGEAMADSNRDLDVLISALGAAAKARGGDETMRQALERELKNPKYYGGLEPEKFYSQKTDWLIDKYFHGVPLSKFMFKAFQLSGEAFWRKIINAFLFPLAGVLYLVFFVPQLVLNKVISRALKNYMKQEEVLANLVDKAISGIASTKSFSVPVMDAIIDGLEEVLLEMVEGSHHDVAEDVERLKEFSEFSYRQLLLNVELIDRAVQLFHAKSEQELKKESAKSFFQSPKKVLSKVADVLVAPQVAEGLGEAMLVAHQKMTDIVFVKQGLFHTLQKLNESFAELPEKEGVRKIKLESLEAEFQDRLKRILSVSIGRRIQQEKIQKFIKTKSLSQKAVTQIIFGVVQDKVKQSMEVASSKEFLRLVVARYLAKASNK